jgi:hypothetical protein
MLNDTVSSVLTRARAKLGDPDQRKYTNGVLLPHLNSACEDLERDLTVIGDVEFKMQAKIVIPAGTKILGATTTPALPADLLTVEWIRERQNGTTDRFIEMKEVVDLDDSIPQTDSLGVWEMRDDSVYFVGATVAVEITVGYWRTLSALSKMSDAINIERAGEVLALRVAFWAAGASDDYNKAAWIDAQYRLAKGGLETLHVKENQIPSTVPAYRFGRSRRKGW